MIQDDHDYSTVDDMKQQVTSNPAYKPVPEHSKQPLQKEEYQAYCNNDISEQEAAVTSRQP